MRKLSEILRENGALDDMRATWISTAAAGEFEVIPRGEYLANIVKGEAVESHSNATPSYRLTFQISEGSWAGRCVWLDCWLTPKAIAHTKRDLAKLGITSLEQLELPLPVVFRCRVKVAVRKSDDGSERNRVLGFAVIDRIDPEPDVFAPSSIPPEGGDPLQALAGVTLRNDAGLFGDLMQ